MYPLLPAHPLGRGLNHADDDLGAALQADPHHLLGDGQAQLYQLVPALEDQLLPGQGGLFQKGLHILLHPGGSLLPVPDRVLHSLGQALGVAVPVALIPRPRPDVLLLLGGLVPGLLQDLLGLLPGLVQDELRLELGVPDRRLVLGLAGGLLLRWRGVGLLPGGQDLLRLLFLLRHQGDKLLLAVHTDVVRVGQDVGLRLGLQKPFQDVTQ